MTPATCPPTEQTGEEQGDDASRPGRNGELLPGPAESVGPVASTAWCDRCWGSWVGSGGLASWRGTAAINGVARSSGCRQQRSARAGPRARCRARHGEQHGEHQDHERLGGDRGAEEPSGAGPPSVESEHQSRTPRAPGPGRPRGDPTLRGWATGPPPRRRTAPARRRGGISRRAARASQREQCRAADHDLVGSEQEPRGRMRRKWGKLSLIPRLPVSMASGAKSSRMPGNVTMRVPAAYTLPNDPHAMKWADRYAPQMSPGKTHMSRCRTTGPHAKE